MPMNIIDSELLLEISVQVMKLLKIGRKQSLTRVLKIKLSHKIEKKIKKRFKITNKYKKNKDFQLILKLEDLERYFSHNNFSKIVNESIEFKIFNRKTNFLDNVLNKKSLSGMSTLNIRFLVSELII